MLNGRSSAADGAAPAAVSDVDGTLVLASSLQQLAFVCCSADRIADTFDARRAPDAKLPRADDLRANDAS